VSFTASELTRVDEEASGLNDLADAADCDVTIAFDGTVASVRFDDARAAALYRSRYRHMLARGEPALRAYAAARGAVRYFWVPGTAAYRWERHRLEPYEIAFLADAVATTHFFTALPKRMVMHAAAVAGDRAAAAIVGTSEAGKTTTALACTRVGLRLFSDEFCFVTPAGVIPFPRSLNLRRGGIELLARGASRDTPLDAWLQANRGADVQDVGYDELLGAWEDQAHPVPLRAVFFVTARAAIARAAKASAAQMLPRVLPWTRMEPQGLEAARALLELLQRTTCYELTLGTPDDTARLIEEALAVALPARAVP
jgi:hypothetical protein